MLKLGGFREIFRRVYCSVKDSRVEVVKHENYYIILSKFGKAQVTLAFF